MTSSEIDKLKTALRWLRSHHHRLDIDRKSLDKQLTEVTTELERISSEIELAERRLRELEER